MADFLLVVGNGPVADRWFERGLAAAAAQGFGAPTARLARPGVRVALFARRGGAPNGGLAESGDSWLCASGTWLGPDGLRPGREADLLARCGTQDVAEVARTLDGFFALLVGTADGVRVVTDAVGSHHVHARSGDGATAIAGSALWLAALDEDRLDPVGCQELLSTGVIYEDRTPWASVRALPPASVVHVASAGLGGARRWWSIGELEPGSLHGDTAVEAFGTAMLGVCARVGAAARNLVSDLTAGWDSRLLAGFLLRAGVPFDTTVTGTADCVDVRLSSRIARDLGLRHLVLPLGGPPSADEVLDAVTLTDGLVNAIGYARVLRVHRELSARFGASLNGSFGEVARGYWWEILKPSPDRIGALDAAQVARSRYARGAAPLDLWPARERLDPQVHLTALIARIDGELTAPAPLAFRLDHVYLRLRMRSWQGRIASSTDRLWPCLSPIGSSRVLEALMRTEPADRIHNRLARVVLARYAPQLAAMPLESGGPALPRELRNAWRFAPEAWTLARRALRRLAGLPNYTVTPEETAAPRLALWQDERVRDALDPGRMALGDHVDRDALRRLLDAMRRPEWPHDLAFGNLLALELGLARARELRARAAPDPA